MLRTRLATAAIAIPALWLIVEFLPAVLYDGFILAVVAVGLFEYCAMALPEHASERIAGVVLGVAVAAAVASGTPPAWGAALALATVGGIAVALARPADLAGGMRRTGLMVLGILYVGFLAPHMVLLRDAGAEGWRWVLFTVYVAMGSDSGGYFTGRAIGRHALVPSISPHKTVEGAAGAVGGALIIAWLCRLVFFPALGPGEVAILGVVVSLFAQLGDLCESALKRAFGAKDSGWIIPGHGGILDRLDSILFPMVFAYYYVALSRV